MWNDLKIGTRVMGLMGVMVGMLLLQGLFGLDALEQDHRGVETLYKDRVVPLKDLKLIADLYAVNIVDCAHKVRDGALSWQEGRAQVEQSRQKIRLHWSDYLTTYMEEEERRLAAQAREAMLRADSTVDRLQSLFIAEDKARLATFVAAELYPDVEPVSQKLAELSTLQLDVARREYEASNERYRRARGSSITFMAVGLVLGGLLALLLSRDITSSLREAVEFCGKVAAGDLTVRLSRASQDETGVLLRTLSDMAERLSNTIHQVLQGANALQVSSEQVSSTARALAQGTTEQATSVRETTSSLEQMKSQMAHGSERSLSVSRMATESAREAELGGDAVRATVEAMRSIAERVTLIEEMAFQTNLLAVNAAIEAVGAGEHGRSFAAVAAEMRRLAERSQAAVREISAVATESVGKAERSGQVLATLVPAIRHTTELVQDMAGLYHQQRTGVEDITKAMSQLDRVAVGTVSAGEQLASTAAALSTQALAFRQTVAHFRLDMAAHAPPAQAPARQGGA